MFSLLFTSLLVVVRGNAVSLLYVPPNEALITGSLFLGSHQVKTSFIGNFTADSMCTMPAAVVLSSGSVAMMAPSVVRDYVYLHYQHVHHRLECLLMYSSGASPTSTTAASMQLSVSDLVSDVSIVYNFYGKSLLYFGPIPDSYASHMTVLGNLTLAESPITDMSAIPITMVDMANGSATTTMHLSAAVWDHRITASDCSKTWRLVGTSKTFSVPCGGEIPPGNVSVVSLRALSAGMHVTPSRVTMYEANTAEFDHFTAWVIVALLMLYLGTWLLWTRDLSRYIDSHDSREEVWWKISVESAPITSAVLLLILTRNMWAAVQESHGMYNIETIDMTSLELLRVYITMYAYVFTPLMVGSSLIVVAYGNSVYSGPPAGILDTSSFVETGTKWLSWSSSALQEFGFGVRLLIFIVAFVVAGTLVLVFWVVTYRNTASAILSGVYTGIVMIYWSSADKLHSLLGPTYQKLEMHDKALLAHISWALRILILMTITANTPYSIDNAFAVQFHTFISIGTGALIAETTGKMYYVLRKLGCFEELLLFVPPAAFAFSYSVLFGFGGLYGSSGALRGESHTTVVCSVTLAYSVFVLTYAYNCIYGN